MAATLEPDGCLERYGELLEGNDDDLRGAVSWLVLCVSESALRFALAQIPIEAVKQLSEPSQPLLSFLRAKVYTSGDWREKAKHIKQWPKQIGQRVQSTPDGQLTSEDAARLIQGLTAALFLPHSHNDLRRAVLRSTTEHAEGVLRLAQRGAAVVWQCLQNVHEHYDCGKTMAVSLCLFWALGAAMDSQQDGQNAHASTSTLSTWLLDNGAVEKILELVWSSWDATNDKVGHQSRSLFGKGLAALELLYPSPPISDATAARDVDAAPIPHYYHGMLQRCLNMRADNKSKYACLQLLVERLEVRQVLQLYERLPQQLFEATSDLVSSLIRGYGHSMIAKILLLLVMKIMALLRQTSPSSLLIRSRLNELLLELAAAAPNSATRRSAGVPQLAMDVLSTAPKARRSTTTVHFLQQLLSLAEHSLALNDVARSGTQFLQSSPEAGVVHALNTLRVIMCSVALGPEVGECLDHAWALALQSSKSHYNFGIRNAASLLFASLHNRVFGVKTNSGGADHHGASALRGALPELAGVTMTHRDFAKKYPRTQAVVWTTLKTAAQLLTEQASSASSVGQSIDSPKLQIAGLDREVTVLHLGLCICVHLRSPKGLLPEDTPMLDWFLQLLAAPDFRIRQKASESLVQATGHSSTTAGALDVLEPIARAPRSVGPNLLHGIAHALMRLGPRLQEAGTASLEPLSTRLRTLLERCSAEMERCPRLAVALYRPCAAILPLLAGEDAQRLNVRGLLATERLLLCASRHWEGVSAGTASEWSEALNAALCQPDLARLSASSATLLPRLSAAYQLCTDHAARLRLLAGVLQLLRTCLVHDELPTAWLAALRGLLTSAETLVFEVMWLNFVQDVWSRAALALRVHMCEVWATVIRQGGSSVSDLFTHLEAFTAALHREDVGRAMAQVLASTAKPLLDQPASRQTTLLRLAVLLHHDEDDVRRTIQDVIAQLVGAPYHLNHSAGLAAWVSLCGRYEEDARALSWQTVLEGRRSIAVLDRTAAQREPREAATGDNADAPEQGNQSAPGTDPELRDDCLFDVNEALVLVEPRQLIRLVTLEPVNGAILPDLPDMPAELVEELVAEAHRLPKPVDADSGTRAALNFVAALAADLKLCARDERIATVVANWRAHVTFV
ncbi:uncharacterized protein MONBRDRAFT_37845 [Monosiga brevicollis MX1]|uniref:DUF2428 domain-containing protein n=1 Tax=Monosiga brevicollis TaxID=81824 RepID=A9V476_MONBE|nr:uncharacterized protein MONBRDRAFT_37845 [Monosiga brevicollis MX1]EDQ87657.1 predicted protein [Monosiga brevicollis MX1]|eukprot:XP_001747577.1 hypothetical protein [Monosiga brevicollis MX1]